MKDKGRHIRLSGDEKAGPTGCSALVSAFPALAGACGKGVLLRQAVRPRVAVYVSVHVGAGMPVLAAVPAFARAGAAAAAAMILGGVTTLWYMIQTVYYTIFKTFLVLYSVSGAGNSLQFWKISSPASAPQPCRCCCCWSPL